jgi:uncharacterized membrane protein
MSGPPPQTSDERMDRAIGNLLRAGVLASAAVVLLGAGLHLARHGGDPVPDRSEFRPEPPEFSQPVQIVRSALSGSGRAIIQFGLLLLIATPVARVAFSTVAFARQRDYLYVAITLVVLAILLYGLFSGRSG